MKTDTIAAIATAVSQSGISIIRISGEDAISIVEHLFVSKKKVRLSEVKSHTIHYGIIWEKDKPVDEVMVSVMKAPHSYTREDVVEINCHGGVRVTRRILDLVLEQGARPAEPGEFTKRAFLNGRIDLSQAEAVMDLISSQNDAALEASVRQLRGNVREELKGLRDCLLQDMAFIEAALDDPEHIQVEDRVEEIRSHVDNLIKQLKHLLKNTETGRLMREGIQTVILGKPNAGKSSFLNWLAGEELAIVTDVEGTTRDTLEQMILLGGIQLNMVDTAGIRETEDQIERIGVDRAKEKAETADLILYLADASRPLDENDEEILAMVKEKQVMLLLNKTDLPAVLTKKHMEEKTGLPVCEISAKQEIGLEELERKLQELFFEGGLRLNEELYITNARQKAALREALASLCQVKESMEAGMSEDFLTIDMMAAYESLGEITGDTISEDLAERIFRDFCMGK